MPLLQLVRHAESANNALYNEIISECGGAAAVASDPSLQRRVDEEEARRRSSDPPLSARGLEQAARVGEHLAGENLDCASTLLVCSPMRRALLTAAPIARGLKGAGVANLRVECHAQYFEAGGCHEGGRALPGRTFQQICGDHPLDFDAAECFPSPDRGWYSAAGAPESDAQPRAERMCLWITERLATLPDTGRVIMVGHGAFMARLLARLVGLPCAGAAALFVHANTGVSTLRLVRRKGSFLVLGLNQTPHLTPQLLTGAHPAEDGWAAALRAPAWVVRRYGPEAVGCYPMPTGLRRQLLEARRRLLWAHESGVGASAYEESDARSVTFVCVLEGSETPAGQVQYDPSTRRLRQMVVLPQFRKLGIGCALVRAVASIHAEKVAGGSVNGPGAEGDASPPLRVHAWQRSEAFYTRCGFAREGDPYESNGVRCVRMAYATLE